MENSPDSPQPLELGVAAGRVSPPEGRRRGGSEAEDGPAGRAVDSGGQGAAAAQSSLGDPTFPSQQGCSAGSDLKDSASSSPAAPEAPSRGQHKVTASPELAEAAAGGGSGPVGDTGTCRVEQAAEEPSSTGALSSSCSEPSPPGDSPSLDSLESFSNLHSFPSSSEFNSEEGAETRVPEDVEEGAAGPPRAAPLCKEEEEEDPAQVLAASKERFPGQSVYHIKWIQWKQENTPIITQNENGPCPLLAILNVLLLAWKVHSAAFYFLQLVGRGGTKWGVQFRVGRQLVVSTVESVEFSTVDLSQSVGHRFSECTALELSSMVSAYTAVQVSRDY